MLKAKLSIIFLACSKKKKNHVMLSCEGNAPPPLPPLPSDSEKLSVVWYRYYLELPNLFIILGSKMQLIGIGYLQANPLQAKKSTRTRATASGESPDLMTGITNDIFCPSNSKIYQKEPGDNKTLL